MFEINTATYAPDNFIAGEFPIAKEVLSVAQGVTIEKYAPVKLVNGLANIVPYVAASAARDYAAAVAAVYTLTIAQAQEAGDTIIINGTTYTCVASGATGNQYNAGTAAEAAASLKTAVEANETAFNVANTGATITFTQKVAGTGAMPTVTPGTEGDASIATTTEYVPITDPEPAKTAAENTAEGLYGIAAEASSGGKVVVYVTGEFFAAALNLEENVTAALLKPAFRNLGVFLK